MFETLRRAIKDSILFKAFMGLLALSFGIWGVGDFLGTGGLDPGIAVKIGKTEVSTNEFQRRFNSEMNRFRQAVGVEASQQEGMKRSVMNVLVQDVTRTATIDNAAVDLGIVVPTDALREAVRSTPAFKDPTTGKFNQAQFNQILAQNDLTESGFLKLFASDLRRAALLKPVDANVTAPNYLSDALFGYRNEARVADTLLLPLSAMASSSLPTNEELKALYDQNVGLFTAPEYRKLSAVVVTAADLIHPQDIDEAELKTYYDENTGRYQNVEKRHVAQLVFGTKEAAEAARAKAAPGDTLDTLTAKAKLGPVVDFGDVAVDSALAKTMTPVFSLAANQISEPIQTDLGWHLFEVKSISPQATAPFDTVKEAIRKTLAEEKGLDAVNAASVQLEDAIAGGTPLPDIVKTVGGHLVEIEAVDANGKDAHGAEVPKLPDHDAFLKAAFSTTAGADSGIKELSGHDGYYVIKVEAVTPPAAKPIEAVRGEVAAIWVKQNQQKEAMKVASQLAGGITASTSMTGLESSDKRLSFAQLGPVTRFGEGVDRGHIIDTKRVSPEVLDKLFSKKVGDVFVAPVNDGFVIARVKDVTPAQPEGELAKARQQGAEALRTALASDLTEQMTRAFSQRYPVDVNTKIINQMVGQP